MAESNSGRPRPFRSQQEGTRDKPYIHYLPPDRAPQITHSGMLFLLCASGYFVLIFLQLAKTIDLATVALVDLIEICCSVGDEYSDSRTLME